MSVLPFSKEEAQVMIGFVAANQNSWDEELRQTNQPFLYLRKQETGQLFSIQYWKEGNWVVHTKKQIDNGRNKKALISFDPIQQRLFARLKSINSKFHHHVEQEAKIINTFSGQRGIIQNYRSSYYQSKKSRKIKFAILQEFYIGSSEKFYSRSLSKNELKILMIDLMTGLSAIHEKGLVHGDLKDKNILIQTNPRTLKVTKAVLCDLGGIMNGQDMIPPWTEEMLKQQQNSEMDRLIGIFRILHRTNGLPFPPSLNTLSGVLDVPGLIPRPRATYQEALEAISNY